MAGDSFKFAFGPFEFEEATGSLTKSGTSVTLQEQPRTILQMLLSCPGQVIARDEIKLRLWGTDTFTDFDRGINTAVGRLRQSLCDSADHPLYIERVPRQGYRFIAPVTKTVSVPVKMPPTPPLGVKDIPLLKGPAVLNIRDNNPANKLLLWFGVVFLFCLLVGIGIYSRRLHTLRPAVSEIKQLTTDGGIKAPWLALTEERIYLAENLNGVLSLFKVSTKGGVPILAQNAFAGQWPSPLDMSPDSGELLLSTTTGLASWSSLQNRIRFITDLQCDYAKWSPDKSHIACIADGDLYTILSDGSQRRHWQHRHSMQGLVWHADGATLRYSAQLAPNNPLLLFDISITNGMTKAVAGVKVIDAIPGALLRNGWYVYVSGHDHELYAARDDGPQFALTHGPVRYFSVFADKNAEMLYTMGQTERGELVYYAADSKTWMPLLGGLSADCLAWSPRGDLVAFVKYPEGDLWRSKVDGSDAVQLSPPDARVYHPVWSPDGSRLAYSSINKAGFWRVFTITIDGSSRSELTPGEQEGWDQQDPNWSPDARKIAFVATNNQDQAAKPAIYSFDLDTKRVRGLPGAEARSSPRWAPSNSSLLTLVFPQNSLAIYDLETSKSRVITPPHMGWPNWSQDGRDVCFLEGRVGKFECISVDKRAVRVIASIPFATTGNTFSRFWDHNDYAGFTPNGRPIVLRDYDQTELYSVKLTWP